MNTKVLSTAFLLVIMLTACTSKARNNETQTPISVSASPTQRLIPASETVEIIPTISATTSPTLHPTKYIVLTKTPSFPKSATLPPSQMVIPTQTAIPTPLDWESLPGLSEVVLTDDDLESVWWIASYPLQLDVATGELSTCLRDCAKYRYSNEYGNLTITLIRTDDNQKATSLANKLRDGFVPSMTTEYTPDNLESMLPGSWLVIHRPANKYYVSASTAVPYGNVVILVTNSYRACVDTDEGIQCEGDLMSLADTTANVTREQFAKLARSGYPK